MTSPVVLNIISRQTDKEHFQDVAKTIIQRNWRKHPPKMAPSNNLSQLILTNGNGQEDIAFNNLKTRGIQNNDKIYLLAHGDERQVEMQKEKAFERNLTAEQLADKFMKQGGLKEAITNHLQTAIHPPKNTKAASNDFKLKIRLLSCLTGKESENVAFNSNSFVEAFNKALMRQVGEIVKTLKSTQVTPFEKSKFSISLETKAPRAWNVTLQDGSNISYFTDSSSEKRIDRQFERQFARINSKKDIPKDLQKYLLNDNEKSRTVKSAVRKYQGCKELDTKLSDQITK